MPRRLLTIKYDGTAYCGWQVQPNGLTVQETLQNALFEILGERPGVSGCSRTDSGVHANMFCLHFDSDNSISCEQLVRALNSKLPSDIAALSCQIVSDDFHARYSSKGKNYLYYINNSPIDDPFNYKYRLRVNKPIDCELVDKACKCFLGTHDFKGFCSAHSSVEDTVRTVTECSCKRNGSDVVISISANGFLYNMVRIIVGTLLEVNNGKIQLEDLPSIIDSGNRDFAGPTVKPHGLFLNKVYYDENDLKAGENNG